MHLIFGGEVENLEMQMKVASNDLIIIEQDSFLETDYINTNGDAYTRHQFVKHKVSKIRKIEGNVQARYCHQACIIGGEQPGDLSFMVVYGGLSTQRECLKDMAIFDIQKEMWFSIAQYGFRPNDFEENSGRYNFGMCYNRISNQIIIFGGQSNKGTFCKPLIHQFQLPEWISAQGMKSLQNHKNMLGQALRKQINYKSNMIKKALTFTSKIPERKLSVA